MPSFAELKEKAVKAKDASVTKIQNTRDRHSSVPLKSTNWDPYSGKPPPPPPPARSISSRTSSIAPSPSQSPAPPPRSRMSPGPSGPLPPPVKRATRPGLASSTRSESSQESTIKWTNLSQEDKEVFFSWLDEFFERSYGIKAQ